MAKMGPFHGMDHGTLAKRSARFNKNSGKYFFFFEQLGFGHSSFGPGLFEVVLQELQLEVVPVPRPTGQADALTVVDPAEEFRQLVGHHKVVHFRRRHPPPMVMTLTLTSGSGSSAHRHHRQLELCPRQRQVVVTNQR